METIFCRNCGQANLPVETACTKCGLNLSQIKNSIPVQNFNKPIGNTPNSTGPNSNPKKNNNLLWILGGVGALVLIGGFLVIVIAAGFFFYAKSGNDDISSNYPVSEKNQNKKPDDVETTKKNDDLSINFPDSTDTKVTEQTLIEYLNKRKDVGSFKHISASSQSSLNLPAKMFVLSEASAFSSYMNTKENSEPLILFMGAYNSIKTAKADFNLTLSNVRKNGASNIKTTAKNGGDAATFSNRGQEMLLTCNSKVCFLFSARSNSALLQFIESFEKKE